MRAEPGARCRYVSVMVVAMTTLAVVATGVAHAQDDDRTRFYFGIRAFDTNPATGVHDAHGLSLGVNLGRYWGLELAGDSFERFPSIAPYGTFGELGIFTLAPEIRLRYPLFDGRLTPYVLAGPGFAVSQFNDRKPRGYGLNIDADRTVAIGMFGGGIEYFVADNIALGVELKYVLAGDQSITIDGISHPYNISSLLTYLSLRLFYPERPSVGLTEPLAQPPVRLYLGLSAGASILSHSDAFPDIEAKVQTGSVPFDKLYGIAAGANFGRYLGAELGLSGHEVRLFVPGRGSIGEYALYTLMPELRVRYPILGGRLQPYALGGVGVSFAEWNDRKPPGANLQVEAKDATLAGMVGGGIEYFIMSNIAVNVEAKYNIVRGHVIHIEGLPEQRGLLDSLDVTLGLRIFLAQFGA